MIGTLSPGPLDIVGDVHGEYAALLQLLAQLGYNEHGEHPQGRRLVFVGDLCDRGPQSPLVLQFVSELVDRGLAQCVLGNHELNLLCQSRKEGNGWHFDDNHDHAEGKFFDSSALPDAAARAALQKFLCPLPLGLERDDLRITHAAWHESSIATARAATGSAAGLYHDLNAQTRGNAQASGLAARADEEAKQWAVALRHPAVPVPLLANLGRFDEALQMNNFIRVITSGVERLGNKPFFSSGKWRMVERCRWWDQYQDDTPVIVGHYWRWPTHELQEKFSRGERDLFAEAAAHEWVGALRNVYCVDFSVGARFKERAAGVTTRFETRMVAVRWPERELVFENGLRRDLS